MSTRLAEKAPHWKPIDLSRQQSSPLVLGCGDDRWPWGGIQFFGGNIGLAMAWATGMELQRRNGFENAAGGIQKPVHVLAGLMHKILLGKMGETKANKILAVNHEGCAAFAGLQAIALTGIEYPDRPANNQRTVVQERAEALAIAQTFSEITEDRFDRASALLAKVAMSRVAPTAEAEAAMLPTSDIHFERTANGLLTPTQNGIPRVPLYIPEHKADVVVVNDDPAHAFDSLYAWEAGNKAYHISKGFLPMVHDSVNPYLGNGMDPQHLEDAITVFTAKTILNLPLPDGQPGQKLGLENVQYLPRVEYALAA